MPNWCYNYMDVNGTGGEIKKFVKETFELNSENEYSFSLEMVLPTPLDENGELTEDWYEWRLSNWGTKWNTSENWGNLTCKDIEPEYDVIKLEDIDKIPDDSTEEASISTHFETAWAPPLNIYSTIRKKYSDTGLEFETMYHEPGVGFGGIYNFTRGEVTNEEKYSLMTNNREESIGYYEFVMDEELESDESMCDIFDWYDIVTEEERESYRKEFYECKSNKAKAEMLYDFNDKIRKLHGGI